MMSGMTYLEIPYLVTCWMSLSLQGDGLLFHKMFLHQIQPDAVLSPEGIKRLYFRVGETKLVYGPEEFCLITGFNFGEYPTNIGKKCQKKSNLCLLRERLFPNYTNSSVKIGDLKSFILNQPFLEVDDADAVRLCLIYILCESFLGKEISDRVPQIGFFAESLDFWNRDMPQMKRWSGIKKLKWVDVNKNFSKIQG
uniref:DUF1985 domain-containing protein n=1 Tax=Lactuca sativa TaxID=4236 RepID=A0A9R1XAZ9_LACSA|nr:hypothetical protein LSAT_V11C600324480 [Lactuca sativa]